MIQFELSGHSSQEQNLCMLFTPTGISLESIFTSAESKYIQQKIEEKTEFISINQYHRWIILVTEPEEKDNHRKAEKLRKLGFEVEKFVETQKITTLLFENHTQISDNSVNFLEGIALSHYQYNGYKTEIKNKFLSKIFISDAQLSENILKENVVLWESVFEARNLVNTPLSHLDAIELAKNCERIGKACGVNVEILQLPRIRALEMGGLLAINAGSLQPPTFTIMEYRPNNAVNKQPVVLIGKGVVYDTGGYSLKPADSLGWMKCDMAGAATVLGTIRALAFNQIPVYTVVLIPATENKLGSNAIVPGDVVTMYNKKTVEVVNTDAEGRLILADALAFAGKYTPVLCVDVATLTGAAMRALGKEGIVYMGTADHEVKKKLELAGLQVHERLVEFPLWEEYNDQLNSDVADFKNLGNGPDAGAIIGGKFLEQFAPGPWLHLDIAPMAYLKTQDSYKGKNGSGVGVRLLYQFLKALAHHM